MPSWKDAVEAVPGGVRLLLEVQPGSKRAAFPDGYNPWRNRIGIRVQAPAEGGRANDDVVRALADFFCLPTARLRIESGHLQSRKSVHLAGLDADGVRSRLEGAMGVP